MAKKANKRVKEDISVRAGHFVGKYVPGAAKKLGRATGKGAVVAKNATAKFSTAFMEGFKEA
jgi:hypothetical protein